MFHLEVWIKVFLNYFTFQYLVILKKNLCLILNIPRCVKKIPDIIIKHYVTGFVINRKDTSTILTVEGREYPVDVHYTLEWVSLIAFDSCNVILTVQDFLLSSREYFFYFKVNFKMLTSFHGRYHLQKIIKYVFDKSKYWAACNFSVCFIAFHFHQFYYILYYNNVLDTQSSPTWGDVV